MGEVKWGFIAGVRRMGKVRVVAVGPAGFERVNLAIADDGGRRKVAPINNDSPNRHLVFVRRGKEGEVDLLFALLHRCIPYDGLTK
jgi:hypothetical protein